MKKFFKKGFTLVELLIVIAIIGILAVAILIGLDPVEQVNRANDTKLVTSAGEVKDAINRFYASKQYYPWCTAAGATCTYITPGSGTCADATNYAFSAAGAVTTNCAGTVLTNLINSGDLKTGIVPDAKLSIRFSGTGASFIMHYDAYSKAVNTQYAPAANQVGTYTDNTCGTVATSASACVAAGTCEYCIF